MFYQVRDARASQCRDGVRPNEGSLECEAARLAFQLQKSLRLSDVCAVFLSFDSKPKACARSAGARTPSACGQTKGCFAGGILFDPKPQATALAASVR